VPPDCPASPLLSTLTRPGCSQVRQNPPGSEAPFDFDLALASGSVPVSAAASSSGAAWQRVPVLRGPLGDLRVRVPAPGGDGAVRTYSGERPCPREQQDGHSFDRVLAQVATLRAAHWHAFGAQSGLLPRADALCTTSAGVDQVHNLLVSQQRVLLWAAARAAIEAEEAGTTAGIGGLATPSAAAGTVVAGLGSSSTAAGLPAPGGAWRGTFLYVLARLLLRRAAGELVAVAGQQGLMRVTPLWQHPCLWAALQAWRQMMRGKLAGPLHQQQVWPCSTDSALEVCVGGTRAYCWPCRRVAGSGLLLARRSALAPACTMSMQGGCLTLATAGPPAGWQAPARCRTPRWHPCGPCCWRMQCTWFCQGLRAQAQQLRASCPTRQQAHQAASLPPCCAT
jgi:hypothetical protein